MGQVYLARDTKLARHVAIKFLLATSPESSRVLLQEARMTAQLSHENIVVVHEVNEYEGRPFMVMEYLEGQSLTSLGPDLPLPPNRAVELIIPVVRALVRAHDHGIVHRDLKPDNIFLTAAGTVKVLDFGIAKALQSSAEQSARFGSRETAALAVSGIAGTLPYMAPEQWGQDHVDFRADFWAVGIILFEMLAGQHPLHPVTAQRLLALAASPTEQMPHLGEIDPNVPPQLAKLVSRCLAKEKSQRFSSAHDLLEELESLASAPMRQAAEDEGRIGRYEILDRLAVGGMAEVFLARTSGPGGFARKLVIKRILPQFRGRPEFTDMFLDEARLGARLQHPNIAQIHEIDTDGAGIYYYAMEFLDGADIAAVLEILAQRGEAAPVGQAIGIAAGVADALDYAHDLCDEQGRPLHVVHRDVSPSNIVVTRQGAVKLVDFGIARSAENRNRTESGLIKGKIAYLSPEQALGKPLDRQTDVFALGIVLYQLLSGSHPFADESSPPHLILQRIAQGEFNPISDLRPELPRRLVEAVHRALAFHPDLRYATAGALRDDLESIAAQEFGGFGASSLSRWLTDLLEESTIPGKPGFLTGHMSAPAPADSNATAPLSGTSVSATAGQDVSATAAALGPTERQKTKRGRLIALSALLAFAALLSTLAYTLWPSRSSEKAASGISGSGDLRNESEPPAPIPSAAPAQTAEVEDNESAPTNKVDVAEAIQAEEPQPPAAVPLEDQSAASSRSSGERVEKKRASRSKRKRRRPPRSETPKKTGVRDLLKDMAERGEADSLLPPSSKGN